jgi:hypothetical protein
VLKTATKVKTQALRAGGQPTLYINIMEPDLDKTSLVGRQAANFFYFLLLISAHIWLILFVTIYSCDHFARWKSESMASSQQHCLYDAQASSWIGQDFLSGWYCPYTNWLDHQLYMKSWIAVTKPLLVPMNLFCVLTYQAPQALTG